MRFSEWAPLPFQRYPDKNKTLKVHRIILNYCASYNFPNFPVRNSETFQTICEFDYLLRVLEKNTIGKWLKMNIQRARIQSASCKKGKTRIWGQRQRVLLFLLPVVGTRSTCARVLSHDFYVIYTSSLPSYSWGRGQRVFELTPLSWERRLRCLRCLRVLRVLRNLHFLAQFKNMKQDRGRNRAPFLWWERRLIRGTTSTWSTSSTSST